MKKQLTEEQRRRELERLAALPEESIDTSDIPERSLADLQRGRRSELFRPLKRPVTMRIDADVLEWLKQQGPGYQTKVNQLLRTEMQNAHGTRIARRKKSANDNPKLGNVEAAQVRPLRVWNQDDMSSPTRAQEATRGSRTPSADTPSPQTPQPRIEAA